MTSAAFSLVSGRPAELLIAINCVLSELKARLSNHFCWLQLNQTQHFILCRCSYLRGLARCLKQSHDAFNIHSPLIPHVVLWGLVEMMNQICQRTLNLNIWASQPKLDVWESLWEMLKHSFISYCWDKQCPISCERGCWYGALSTWPGVFQDTLVIVKAAMLQQLHQCNADWGLHQCKKLSLFLEICTAQSLHCVAFACLHQPQRSKETWRSHKVLPYHFLPFLLLVICN